MKQALLLLALIATQAHAQIIYTDVVPDATYTGTTDTCSLDVDNDGNIDFLIVRGTVQAPCPNSCNASQTRPRRWIRITPQGTNAVANSGSFPAQLPLGQSIGPGLIWSNASDQDLVLQSNPGCRPFQLQLVCVSGALYTGSWSGTASVDSSKFLGLRFESAGTTYYGWARLSIPWGNPATYGESFTLKDYAYNSVPDEAIFAGETQCTIPFGLSVNTVDSNTVTFTWQTFNTDTFNLRYRPTGTTTWSVIDTVTTTNFTIEGLTGCTEYEFQVEGLCDGLPSGYTGIIHTTDGCCSVPGLVTVGVVAATSTTVSWGGVTAANSYDAQISADGGTTWTLISGIPSSGYTFTDLDSCTTYVVQVRTVCNGGTTDWSTTVTFKTFGCGSCLDLTYCPSMGMSTLDEWIARVAVGTLDNQSGANDGYGDFTTLGTDLQIGQGHPITLAPGYSFKVFPEYFKVFVDLDQNGNFTGPGELAYSSGMVGGTVTGTLNIPASALVGSTRMRVIMLYDDPTAVGCTNNYDYGETEDYCVNLVESTIGVGESPNVGQLHVFPNPFRSMLTVSMGMHKAGVVTCMVRAVTGQALVTRTVAPTGGSSTITLDLSSLAPGTYLLEMQTGGERIVRKVVKE
ncbi:MAG TPA: GEVED domain-containing protein [Flavobacteriales bacterium]|nr:GEVED domain-containing protein [Flavobacteriales bacterium]